MLLKVLSFICFLLCSLAAFATPVKVELQSHSNLGWKKSWSFEKVESGYRLNGLLMPAGNVYNNPAALRILLNVQETKLKGCAEGEYVLVVKKEVEATETGCLSSPRYAMLRDSFERLVGR